MKRLLVIGCILIVSLPAFSQAIDPAKIELNEAELAIAGPDEVYVTNILYDGQVLSVRLKWDGGTGATIYGPWFAEDKVLLDSDELGYATVSKVGANRIRISGIIVGSTAYSGTAVFDGVSKFRLEEVWETAMPFTTERQIAALRNRIEVTEKIYQEIIAEKEAERAADKLVYEAEIEQLEGELAAALEAAELAGVAAEEIETIVSRPTRIAASGFTGGRGISGNWTVTSSRISQTDDSAYFAKFMLPLSQTASQTMYSINAKADQSGFAGYGLHFFASDDRQSNGYGFGTSYLVWLTRDPSYYGSEATYLQLYKSYNDVQMIQSASIIIPQSIDSTNTTELLYDRTTGRVTVWVNGTQYLAIDIPAAERINRGSKIALRSLGKATFTGMTVKTR